MKVQASKNHEAPSAINQATIDRYVLAAKFHASEARRLKKNPSLYSYHRMAAAGEVYSARVAFLREVSRLGSNHPQFDGAVAKLRILREKVAAQNQRHYRAA